MSRAPRFIPRRGKKQNKNARVASAVRNYCQQQFQLSERLVKKTGNRAKK
jgi:hypothetical protein